MTAYSSTAELSTAESPRRAFSMSCGPASYVAAGAAVLATLAMSCEPAGVTLAGQDILQPAIMLTADPAAYAVAAQPVGLQLAIALDPASYLWSAEGAQMAMPADAAAYVLAGQAALTSVSMDAVGASFALAMPDVISSMAFQAEPAAFVTAGQDVLTLIGAPLAPASYALYGAPVFQIWRIGANIPGQPSTAEYGTAEFPRRLAFSLSANAAAYQWGAPDVILTTSLEAASFTWTVGTADMAIGADAAAYQVAGQDALTTLTMKADASAFVVAPQDIALLALQPATYLFTPADAEFRESLLAAVYQVAVQDIFQRQHIGAEPAAFAWSPQKAVSVASLLAGSANYTIVGWSISDITGPRGNHVYLVEVQYHDGVSVKTAYLSTDGFTSMPFDTPPNQYYEPRIRNPGNFERSLFSGTELRGRSKSAAGNIRVISASPGNGEVLDDWFTYGWAQRAIRIMSLQTGARSLSGAAALFSGKLSGISSSSPLDYIDLQISDRLSDLEKPLLTQLFAGTTLSTGATADGNLDMKGKIKQDCFGIYPNVTLQLANQPDLIYLAANKALHSITVFDGGGALIDDGNSASLSALQAASIAGGHYRTCLALGLVRMGALPSKAYTADVIEGATAADRTAGQIAYRMLLQYGIASNTISTGSITVLDGNNPGECGYFVGDDRTVLAAVQDVLDSINATMSANRDGTLIFDQLREPSSAPQSTFDIDTSLIGDSMDREESEPPVWRVRLEYGPNFTVQGDADLLAVGGLVDDDRRSFVATQFRVVTAEDTAVLEKHLDAREVTIRTYLVDEDDAQEECDRQLALLSVERDRYSVSLPLVDGWPTVPGESITLRHPRLNLRSGKPFIALRRADKYETDTIDLSLWG